MQRSRVFPTMSGTRQEGACTSAFHLYRQVITETFNYGIKDKRASCVHKADLTSSCVSNRLVLQSCGKRQGLSGTSCAVRKSQGLHQSTV